MFSSKALEFEYSRYLLILRSIVIPKNFCAIKFLNKSMTLIFFSSKPPLLCHFMFGLLLYKLKYLTFLKTDFHFLLAYYQRTGFVCVPKNKKKYNENKFDNLNIMTDCYFTLKLVFVTCNI